MRKKVLYLIIIFFTILIELTSISLCDDIDDETVDVLSEIQTSDNIAQNSIKTPDLNSRACVVIDRKSNIILYGKNENEQRKMASTTKIMTSLIIIENCDLKETVEISKKVAGTGGSRLGLKAGDKITIHDLLYGLMLRSGNDAAVALAEYAGGDIESFAELMNKKAQELSLSNTHFETPHGLDSDNHYTTAYELALLSNYALNNKTFSQIVGTKDYTITINGNPKNITNTNELLGNLNGVYGIKTGFTNGANRCLVTACKRGDIDIICVVLGADTKKFRTQDSVKLINYVMDNFKQVNVQEIVNNKFQNWENENLSYFEINKSISQNIELKIDELEYSSIPVRKDLIDNISISIICETKFESPLLENTKIGNIHISISEYCESDCLIYNNITINRT